MINRLTKGGIALAIITAICSGAGIALLKLGFAGDPFQLSAFLAGLAVYGVGIVCGIVLLGIYPISIAYPVVVGLSLVVVAGISATALGEAVSTSKLAGTALIVLGVYLLVRPSRTVTKQK